VTRFDCGDPRSRAEGIAAAAAALESGELAVLPTDTVYGVAADPASAAAVQALLDAKGRTAATPPPVLISDAEQLGALVTSVPPAFQRLADTLWPGGLTLVLPAADLGWHLGETHGTVALRVPADEVARELLRRTGPLAVSSANLHGQPSACDAAAAQRMLGDSVAVYLDGGPTPGGTASTIVAEGADGNIRFIRHGAIPDARVLEVAEGAAR
jgi:tRNA threonylcarbamoyl adenosine modification protein (Sua5/YciO/YrdC/YwlC family)